MWTKNLYPGVNGNMTCSLSSSQCIFRRHVRSFLTHRDLDWIVSLLFATVKLGLLVSDSRSNSPKVYCGNMIHQVLMADKINRERSVIRYTNTQGNNRHRVEFNTGTAPHSLR